MFKTSLPEVKNISFFVVLIILHVRILNFMFFNFLDLEKILNILLALLSTPTTLLLLAYDAFRANNTKN